MVLCIIEMKLPFALAMIITVKAYIRKGHALLGLKDTVKAAQAFQAALELDPNSAVSLGEFSEGLL